MRKIYLSLSLLLLSLTLLPAQAVPEQLRQQARQEIQKRGLDEQEVRQRLLARGIDIDNMNVEQLQAAQPQIEAVIQELEAEKMSKPTSSASRDTSPTATNDQQALEKIATDFGPEEAQDIREKIDQGATVQETISEELQEKAKENDLDPPTRIYGQEIFRNKTLEIYRASRDIKPPNSYILGAGDVINISIFGTSQADLQFEIDPDGFIRPSNMPRVYLKGVNYGQAKELLRQRFRQAYRFRPEQFAVSINAARTMTINIFGEVENQGSFTLSAINTAFNALVAAGGPTDIGSVRNIRLMRGGEERYLDVYAFMQDPALQYEFYLEDNDILFVPIAERVVSIQGAVNRPLRYELIEGEELMSLINFAGGLQANAYTDLIQIRRFTDNEELLIDVSLQELLDNKEDFLLRNGDQVLIKRIPEAAENRVSISGAVQLPGDYALIEGLRVSDLLRRGVLQEEAKLDVAFLFRRQLDNSLELVQLNLEAILNNPGQGQDLLLRKRDRLLVFTQERYVDTYEVSISGAVRKPMQQEYEPALRISDLLYLAGGLSPQATNFAYLLRKDPAQPNDVEYIRIDLSAILADSTSVENRLLQPLDELRVLNRNTYVDQATVRVSGAVRNPGEFPYDSTLSIENALTLAGGLELQAASNRIDIFRLQIDENQPTRTLMETITINKDGLLSGDAGTNFALAPFDQIVVRAVPEFEFQQSVQLEGEVLYPGTYALLKDNERLSDLIERAGGLTPEAYLQGAVLNRSENGIGIVVIELDKALSQTGSRADLVLKQGDVLTIPKPQEVVSIRVLGTEANELYSSELIQNGRINIAYQGNKSAKWYIKNYASGFDKRARRSSTSVEYPSGRIDGTDNFLFVKNYPTVKPGSEIRLVLKEPKAEREDREPVDWGKVASDVLTSATAALSFILLIQRI